jgi:hypothetical protein
MIYLAAWFVGLVLLATLMVRALRAGFVSAYSLFYVYVCFVFLTSSFLLVAYLQKSRSYSSFYWPIEAIGALLGCGVVWEIYRGALGRFPGAARMARNALLLILAIVLSRVIANVLDRAAWWPSATMIEVERDLRAAQAVVLIGLVLVLLLYRIPLGRNLWGMALGYGLLIGTNLITLALRAFFGQSFQTAWRYLQPISYLAVLATWCATLWSYHPAPQSATHKIENDYALLAAVTRRSLLQVRSYLKRATGL